MQGPKRPNQPGTLEHLREGTNNTGFENTVDALLSFIGDEQVTRNVMKTIALVNQELERKRQETPMVMYPPGVR